MTYLTRSQVADLLGVHTNTVDVMVKAGRLPKPIKLSAAKNGHCRFLEDAVHEAIAKL